MQGNEDPAIWSRVVQARSGMDEWIMMGNAGRERGALPIGEPARTALPHAPIFGVVWVTTLITPSYFLFFRIFSDI